MRVQRVIAAVSDIDRAEVWFTDLFGTGPDARPMEGLIEWHFGAAGHLQVAADAERAGGSMVTLHVDSPPRRTRPKPYGARPWSRPGRFDTLAGCPSGTAWSRPLRPSPTTCA